MAITSNHYSPYTGDDVDRAVSSLEAIQDIHTIQTLVNSGGRLYAAGSSLAYLQDVDDVVQSSGFVTSQVASQIASSVASGTISGAIISGDAINTVVSGEVVSGALVVDAATAGLHIVPAEGDEVHINATPQGAELSYGGTVLLVSSGATVNGEEIATKPYVEEVAATSATEIASGAIAAALEDYSTTSETIEDTNARISSALTNYPTSSGVSTIASSITSTALLNYPNNAGVSGIIDAKLGNYVTSLGAATIANSITAAMLESYPNSSGMSVYVSNALTDYPTSSGASIIASGIVNSALVDYPTSSGAALIASSAASEVTSNALTSGGYVDSAYVSSALQDYTTSGSALQIAQSVVTDCVKYASTLPAASSALEGQLYVYTGATDTYEKGHVYECVSVQGFYEWQDSLVGAFPPPDCSNIRCITQGSVVRLKWRDPDDVIIEGVPFVKWGKTVLVRKQGSYPADPSDGTVIVTNTTRNQYASTAYTDSLPDASLVYYYQWFIYSKEGALNSNTTNRAVTNDLTWASIQDIVRSGEAQQYFGAGDALTVPVYNIGMTAQSNWDMRIVGFDKMNAAPMTFVRDAGADQTNAYAWRDINGDYIYTTTASPAANDEGYLDAARTVETATVISLDDGVLTAKRLHSLTLEFVRVLDSIQQDAGEKEYAFTHDTVYHPEYRLSIKIRNSGNAIMFLQTDRTQTGTDRVWWSYNGQYKLWYPEDRARWEIWRTNSGTHAYTDSIAYDWQTTPNSSPTGGTWNYNSPITHANTYYSYNNGTYTALVEGTNYQQGDAIPADTVYEKRPDNNRQYGYNRWKETGIRQYLNSTGTGWWSAQNVWDAPPSYQGNRGFLDRLPADLVKVVNPTRLMIAINTADSGGGSEYTEDKFFYLAANEVGLGLINGLAEGDTLDYYLTAEQTDRIKLNAQGNASTWWLRSPNVGNAYLVYVVHTSGSLNNINASTGTGCSPACNII